MRKVENPKMVQMIWVYLKSVYIKRRCQVLINTALSTFPIMFLF